MEYLKIIAFSCLAIVIIHGLRYLILSSASFFLIRKTSADWKKTHRLQAADPSKDSIRFEIRNAFFSILIFGFVMGSVFNPLILPSTKISTESFQFDWLVLISFLLMVCIHDTYFYFMHRWMHEIKFLRQFHHVHHRSLNPSPYASQSFHWVEALLEIVWIVPFVFLVPVPRLVLIVFSFFTICYNIYGHLGFELATDVRRRPFIFRYLNTSTHHNLHHKNYMNGNYGLYFLFWDRLLKTEKLT